MHSERYFCWRRKSDFGIWQELIYLSEKIPIQFNFFRGDSQHPFFARKMSNLFTFISIQLLCCADSMSSIFGKLFWKKSSCHLQLFRKRRKKSASMVNNKDSLLSRASSIDGFLTFFVKGWKVKGRQQGDQIGRIFAHWVTVNLREFLEKYKSSSHFWATFFHSYFWLKNRLGYILGHFFKNSSGRPARQLPFSPRVARVG
jgi:hypothetical protein